MYELRQLWAGVGFCVNTILDTLIPARVEVAMPFGPRTVWGPVQTPSPETTPAAPVEDDEDDFPTGEFPLELAEQLRQTLNVPAGGVESTPPADSAAGGHPVLSTSELLGVAGRRLGDLGFTNLARQLLDRAAQFAAAGD